MSASLRISLAQVSGNETPAENLVIARKYIGAAAREGAELIVFPEMFMALPQKGTVLGDIAEPLDGKFVTSLGSIAREYGVHVACGVWEQLVPKSDKAGNAAVVINSDGEVVCTYRKIHLFNALSVCESDTMCGGDVVPPVFAVRGIKLSIGICYDLRFPELFRNAALNGVDGFIVPSAWYAGPMKEDHWLTLLRARAIENTAYIAGVNLCGSRFCGRSAAFDPFGVALCDGGETENLVSFTMTGRRIDEVREKLPSLANARPELFAAK